MRCVVTGAAGFIGSQLSEKLLEQGHEVIGIDSFVDYYPRSIKEKNLSKSKDYNRFKFVEADLCDLQTLKHLEGAQWIFHQAAQAGVRASWGESFSIYTHNNIEATQVILEAAKSELLKSTIKKIVYASSSSVYGDRETLPTTEDMRPSPISPYGVSKLAAEHLMVLYAKEFGVPTVSLRYFTVYGPRQRPDMAFNRFIKAGLIGETLKIYGTGEQSRDFTFVSDIVDVNILAAEAENTNLVFNVGGGSRVTVNEVLKKIENILGKKLSVEYQQRQKGDAPHTGADTSLARKELKYDPKFTLDQGLALEAKWIEENL